VIERFLDAALGDRPDRARNERPNLHHAVIRGRSPEFVRLLVERGADVSLRDPHGRTAYAHAGRRGHVELARVPEDAGA
jgi:ankyrin repeat protein